MADSIIALSAVTLNLLTIIAGVYVSKRTKKTMDLNGESMEEIRGKLFNERRTIESLERRIKVLEEEVRSCEKDRLALKKENYQLLREINELRKAS